MTKQRRVLKVFGRTVVTSGGAMALIVLFAAVMATTVAVVAGNALGGTGGNGTVGSQSPVGGTPGSTTTTTTPTPTTLPALLANGPDQSRAPDFSNAGGEQPGYGNYNAVACPSVTSCVAVGADNAGAGVAGSSADGGSIWQHSGLPSGTPVLDAVACGDTNHCIGVGQGAITVTKDGGSTWSLAPIPVANTTLIGATCPSASQCIASGITEHQAGPLAGTIVRSNDGGNTWSQATVPLGTQGIGDVVCPSPTRCIAVGAALLVSQDGGATWSNTTVPGGTGDLRSVSCSSTTVCVAIGSNPQGLTDSSASAYAIVTNDGGDTWTSETLPAATATLDQISCASATECLAGGLSATPGGSAPLYRSDDGGATWAQAPTSPSGISQIASISCPTTNHCAVVGRRGNGSASTSATSDLSSWTGSVLPGDAVPPATNSVS